MRRDLTALLDGTFDLLVVGAGIHGACIAWDASLRGLSVALLDRGDFGAATSANSLRIIHGGLRYLSRVDLPRMVESIRERSILLRIAPELVEPLPVLVPTYREMWRGRVAFGAALRINDLVSLRRNRGLRPDRVLPRGQLISREECLRLFPWFPREGLTGGALWYDARVRHPERLTLGFVRSAADQGAVTANYVAVKRLLVRNGSVHGVAATDIESGSEFEVRAHAVVVAAGPWTRDLLAGTLKQSQSQPVPGHALAVNVWVDRPLASIALGVQARSGPPDDPICGGFRYLFATPQNGASLLGTWYTATGNLTAAATRALGVRTLIREFNQACPGLELTLDEVTGYQWGWLPLKNGGEPGRITALRERPRIIDHGAVHQVRHLLSVEGVKYTTARAVARRVVDWVFQDRGGPVPPCRTDETALTGTIEPSLAGGNETITATISHAVHQEMALRLSDIVFRRTSLGTRQLARSRVTDLARLAGGELGWDTLRQEAEVEDVMRQLSAHPAEEPVG
jgi:glycerol-3-phosphate dehydrogenase